MQCSAVQCSAVQCSAVQCSAVQCSAVQCSAVQCSAEWRVLRQRGSRVAALRLKGTFLRLLCRTEGKIAQASFTPQYGEDVLGTSQDFL